MKEKNRVKKTLKKAFFLGTLMAGSVYANHDIPLDAVFIPHSIRDNVSAITYENGHFEVADRKSISTVQKYNTDKTLKALIEHNRVVDFIESGQGYFTLKQYDDGSYGMNAQVRLRGGGPISGAIGYWVTKTLCYGTAVAATGAAVVATGGAAGAVTGAIAASATAGASTAVGVTAGAIAGAGLTGEAALVTTSAVGAAGGVAATVTAVESASFSVGAFLTAIPFLP